MQYQPFEPDIEILGAAVYATVAGFGPFKSVVESVLERAGIALRRGNPDGPALDLDGWYPQQPWLNSLREVEQRFGAHVLLKIGAAIPTNAVFPPSVVDIHSGLQSIDVAYHLNHRRRGEVMFDPATGSMTEGIGHYGYERQSDTCVRCPCQTPYPCQFDLGIVTAMARRFAPAAKISHVGKDCRRDGAEACEYEVTWTAS